ncbi:MAG: ATP-binding protein [Bdellovibrionia bacterium]
MTSQKIVSLNLLLIEDSEDDAFLITRELEKGGYQVHCHRIDTVDGLTTALTKKDWDLIICDYSMPGFDALVALAMVKEVKLDIPFIVISGAIGESTAVETMRGGAHDYLMKGNLKRLIPAVSRELHESSLRKMQRFTADALKESEYRFSLFVGAVKECAIFMTDSNGNIIHWNPGAENMTGYKSEEVVGGHYSSFYREKESNPEASNLKLDVAIKQGVSTAEGWRIRKDNSVFWADELISSVRNESRQLTGFVTIVRDITLRKQAEDELKNAREKALEASRLKSDFLANISHELRTPLNGILGMCELILSTPLNEEQSELFQTLQESGELLLEIVSGLLDFSKIESGKIKIENIDFSVEELVEKEISVIKFKVHKKNIFLKMEIAPDVPKWVRGDPGKLGQVLLNLLDNAAKFTEKGGVTLRTSLDSHPSTLKFEIVDTGIGLLESTIKKLFNPFIQADGSTTRKYGGTGLGLSITKKLVEFMGGQIGVNSVLGHGSTFWFTVPFELGHEINSGQPSIRG